MCEPMTIAATASLAAGALSAKAALDRGQQQSAALGRSAASAEARAADAVARGQLPSARARMRGGQLVGTQITHEAASGALVGVGSAGDLLRETREITDQDAEVISNNAYRDAFAERTQAGALYQQAKFAQSAAENEALTSVIGGVGSAVSLGAKGWLQKPQTGTG